MWQLLMFSQFHPTVNVAYDALEDALLVQQAKCVIRGAAGAEPFAWLSTHVEATTEEVATTLSIYNKSYI